jgi:hypothetical protein
MSERKVEDYGSTAAVEDTTLQEEESSEDEEWELNKVLETIGLLFLPSPNSPNSSMNALHRCRVWRAH